MGYGAQGQSFCPDQSLATPVPRREPLPALRWQALGPQLAAAASAGGSSSSSGSLAAASAVPRSGGTTNSGDSYGPCSTTAALYEASDSVELLPLYAVPAVPLVHPFRLGSEQREQEQAAADACMTPRVGRFQFGTPLSSPVAPRMLPAASTLLGGSSSHATPVRTPQNSAVFGALRRTSPVAPPSPVLSALTPQVAPTMRSCSVKLSGSVRLMGTQIISMAQPSQRAFLNPALPSASSESAARASPSQQASQQAATSWHRELSFADLLSPQVQRGSTSSTSTLPLPPAASPTPLPPTASPTFPPTPFVPLRLAGGGAGIRVEMALSPRKRARKSQAPARAAACADAPGAAPGALPLPGGPAGEGEDVGEDSALPGRGSDQDVHSTPCKTPRHK